MQKVIAENKVAVPTSAPAAAAATTTTTTTAASSSGPNAHKRKRRTLRDAEKELEDARSSFHEAKKKLIATARENAKMRVLLMKYIDKDDSLLSSSQLSVDDSAETERKAARVENDISLPCGGSFGMGGLDFGNMHDLEESSGESSSLWDDTTTSGTVSSGHDTDHTDPPMLSQLSQVSQWSELSCTSHLDEIISFLDKQEANDSERLATLETEFRDLQDEKTHVRVGVGVLLLSKKHPECVLIGKRKGSHGEGRWALPGGHLEMYESWEECARREIKEETDLDIEDVKFAYVTNDPMDDEGKHYITLFMYASVPIHQQPRNMEPNKCEGWQWMKYEQLQTMENLFLPLLHLTRSKFTLPAV